MTGDATLGQPPIRGAQFGARAEPAEPGSRDIEDEQIDAHVVPALFAEPPTPVRIGRYIVLGRLGQGSMGVVYSAFDEKLDRKVAIKVIHRSVDLDTQLRAVREAQALARLAHPNVVGVYDVNAEAEGAWIAMESISGRTLGAWASERPRRWREVLRVLTETAAGVAAAHAEGLVHRDLKPENVMIGDDDRVRVLDFGLAHGRSALEDHPEEGTTLPPDASTLPEPRVLTLQLTPTHAVQGTPAYLAPEQWLGEAVTAASDQFGWSVMAWELLFGERPFAGETSAALRRNVLAGARRPPPKHRRVPGWLRQVVERGLAREPDSRWPSMRAVVAELSRGQMRSRLRRVAGALGGAAAVLAGVMGYGRWHDARVDAACIAAGVEIHGVWNDDARRRLREAFVRTGEEYAATTATRVVPWIDGFAEEWRSARTDVCRHEDRREGWGAAAVHNALWCLEDSRVALESLLDEFKRADADVIQKAVAGAASLGPVRSCTDPDLLRRQASPPMMALQAVREVRAELARARSLELAGRYAEGLRVATHARERAQHIGWSPLVAAARGSEGEFLEETAAFLAAERVTAEAYYEAARSGAWDVAADAALELVWIVGHDLTRGAEGRGWARHAEVAADHAGDFAELRESRRLNGLATILQDSGAAAASLPLLRRSLQIREAALGPDHPAVAKSLDNLAIVYFTTGSLAEARAMHERSLDIRERQLGPDHPEVARALTNLANVNEAEAEYTTARIQYERALDIQRRALDPAHPRVALAYQNLAGLYVHTGDYREARALFHLAVEIYQKALPPDHPDLARALANLAVVLYSMGEYAPSRALQTRALGIRERTLGAEHIAVSASLNNLGIVCYATGDYAVAKRHHERALRIRERTFGPYHTEVASSLNNLANAHKALGEIPQAAALYRRSLEIREHVHGPAHPDVAASLNNLAALSEDLGASAEARPMYERALAIWEKELGPQHVRVATGLSNVANLYLDERRPADALPLLERAVTIYEANSGVQEGEPAARFNLAVALFGTGGDRRRALAEAKKARDGYRGTGQGASKVAAEVESWLARPR